MLEEEIKRFFSLQVRSVLSFIVSIFLNVQKCKFGSLNFNCTFAGSVFGLPLTRFYPSFDINFITLRKIFFTNLSCFVSNNYIVPFGGVYFFTGLFVDINLIGCQRESSNAVASFKIVHLYIIS